MVLQKKQFSEVTNGTSKRDQSNMSYRGKDMGNARSMGSNSNRIDTKNQNGTRNFRTDTAISNNRNAAERTLKPWVPDVDIPNHGALEGGLESNSGSNKPWDQFEANEKLFGTKSTYDENIYTTRIDRTAPGYSKKAAHATKVEREIEGTAPTYAHVAEERQMDFVGGKGQDGDEEDKYSGVRRGDRNDFLSSGLQNRYTPPARRAPTAQATVAGAPVDPAIISAQVKGSQTKKPSPPKPEEPKVAARPASSAKPQQAATNHPAKTENKSGAKPAEAKEVAPQTSAGEQKSGEKAAASSSHPAAMTTRLAAPQTKETEAKSANASGAANAPSAASTVEHDVLKAFKGFAGQQRVQDQQRRSNKIKQDTHVKLQELKKFAEGFKLSTPVPNDLISIIAKDPAKQKQIQQKALDNINELKTKETPSKAEPTAAPKEGPVKAAEPTPAPSATPASAADSRNNSRPAVPQHTPSPSSMPNRHQGGRQSYAPHGYNQFPRNDRSAGGPRGAQQTGHLSERLRQNQVNNRTGPPHFNQDMRGGMPPTGPANSMDPNFNRRIGAIPQGHMGPKLNPNSHEFRPSAFAAPFNPTGPSAGSSPRSAVNNVVETPPAPAPQSGQVIRRKTKAIDRKKCCILSNLKTQQPPQDQPSKIRSWDDNNGLRPSWDPAPTWRAPKDASDEEKDTTMLMTYKEYFEKMPYLGASVATPNPQHVYPQQIPHQHQLPLSLQHSSHGVPRQSPHMAPMQLHPSAHGHVQQGPFGHGDEHRMMHSNSNQSYASPRVSQVPIYPPNVNGPGQLPYGQPVMGQFMPSTPQINQFGARNFSNSPQYMPQQGGPIAMPMMPPGQFVAGQSPMIQGGPQMQMYPGGPQFMTPTGGAPPQGIPVSTGYPSPGRPAAAPMMIQQNSQQGQPGGYGVSPGMQFQQPFNPQQHPGHMSGRGYSNGGPQQYGTSPQQMHPYPRDRNGSNNYGGKGYQGHNQHQSPHNNNATPSGPQGRTPDGPEESK